MLQHKEFGYAIYLAGVSSRGEFGRPDSLKNARLVAYEELYSDGFGWHTGLGRGGYGDVERNSAPLTSSYVLRLQNQIQGGVNKMTDKKTKVKVKSKHYGNSKVIYYNCGPSIIADKRILILDNIGDSLSKAKMMEAFNISADRVFIVGNKEIEKAIETQDQNIIVIYDLASPGSPVGYSTNGRPIFVFRDRRFAYTYISFYIDDPYQKRPFKGGRQ